MSLISSLRRLLLLLLLSLVSVSALARDRIVSGYVMDREAREGIINVKVSLLRADSTVVDTMMTGKCDSVENFKYIDSRFQLTVPGTGHFILRFEAFGYITAYKDIEVKDSRRNGTIEIGVVYMMKDRHVLEGVTVTATKIKMVMRGDTVVFNADAFQMAEGSMLDALIKQLPGVSLKSDGRIMMNGKFVESLFVNGKEFFQGDPKVALENLPSYMVKDVKVYNKKDEMSNAPQVKKDEHIVMDVRLKKQYSSGWIVNVGAGWGTHDRYTGRLFALRFSDHSRFSAVGNVNNLNDFQQPGEDDADWDPKSMMGTGRQTVKTGGLSYRLENKSGNLVFQTDNKVERRDDDNRSTSSSETFLPSGNVFSRSASASKGKSTSFSTNDMLRYTTNRVFFNSMASVYYDRGNTRGWDRSGSFSSDPELFHEVLDSLFLPGSFSEKLRLITSNRSRNESLNRSHNMRASLMNSLRINTSSQTQDGLFISTNLSYTNNKNRMFSLNDIDYPSNTAMASDSRNQFNMSPTRSYDITTAVRYQYVLRNDYSKNGGGTVIIFEPHYNFNQSYNSATSSLYRLDKLTGWGQNNVHPLGALPSTLDSLQLSIDAKNSSLSGTHKMQNEAGLRSHFYFGHEADSTHVSSLNIDVDLPVSFERNSMSYYRNAVHYPKVRRNVFFSPRIDISRSLKDGSMFSIGYNLNSSAPSLTSLVDVRDDSNPLFVSLGNPDLKNSHTHTISFSFNHFENMQMLSANVNYSIRQNAGAMGFVYDKSTGIRTTKPENVNGNWSLMASANYMSPLGKKKVWVLESETTTNYNNSVDLASEADATTSTRSTVHNLTMGETAKLEYHHSNDVVLRAKVGGNWVHSSSRRENFSTINAGDFNYGLAAQLVLPWKVQLSTDMTMYSRRGYSDHQMNTDELVWNARLSKTLCHGRLTCMIDGFDLLGRLSNVQRTLNEQGRTEVYSNVIPRYVLCHFIYRLNTKPKKDKSLYLDSY
jgi:hypothetical protein